MSKLIKIKILIVSYLIILLRNNPLSAAVLIILFRGISALFLGILISKWLFISIFIIFLGGIIIIFFYVIRLTKFKINLFTKIEIIGFGILAALVFYYIQERSVKQSYWLKRLFLSLTPEVILFLAFYLFIILIISVKITQSFKGSLLNAW